MDGYDRLGQRVKMTDHLNLALGQLAREGTTMPISDRDFAIVAALATHEKPLPPADLGAMVLPGIEERVAVNALNVSIHRLRTRIGDPESFRYSHARGAIRSARSCG